MKFPTAILALCLFILPGCSQLDAVTAATNGTVSSVIPDQMNVAKKALTAAHEVHRATADFLAIAADTNLCHAQCAATAKQYLDQSEAALVAADKLVAVGDAPGIEAKIQTATAAISAVQALVGKK